MQEVFKGFLLSEVQIAHRKLTNTAQGQSQTYGKNLGCPFCAFKEAKVSERSSDLGKEQFKP